MISSSLHRIAWYSAASLLPLLMLGTMAFAPHDLGHAAAARNRYIGAKACKNCHKSKAKGEQFAKWSESKHAKAYARLGEQAAKETGAKLGVTDPQQDAQCLKCHVTAYGLDKKKVKRSFDPKQGVQCESCHGPGERHAKARFKAASSGDADPEAYTEVPEDEIIRQPGAKVCLECHNEKSPSFKPFCFKERRAVISHLNPQKPRTAEDLEALKCTCEDCKCKQAECGDYPKHK